ncbi:MAG: thiamine phosphate synthase [Parabacteroides sp.]|nr:thiamine phosphate synthase [Parabacteroides sp.]
MDTNNYINRFIDPTGYANFKGSSRLMFITHRTERYTELQQIQMVMEGGCDWVQLRMKERLEIETARKAAAMTASRCVCCLNDHVEMALEAGIDCVHVGKKDIPVAEAWQIIKEKGRANRFLIGATANTFEDIVQAERQGASYIGLGPFRFTYTKKNLSPVLGLEGIQKIVTQCKEAGIQIPIFAIGGILFEDIAALMQTGITGIAVSGALLQATDPVQETKRFIQEIQKFKQHI